MPSWFDSWFGLQQASGVTVEDATLIITDGDISVEFTNPEGGWCLRGEDGWAMAISEFKGGGVYLDNASVDGAYLKHTAFGNVIETWRVQLRFFSPDDMIQRIDELNELLKVRAPKYMTDRFNNRPVYYIRQLPGESKLSYGLLSQGSINIPPDVYDIACTLDNGLLEPVQIVLNRQPFLLGAPPGQVQDTVELSAQQIWNFDLDWTQETALPAGQVFCFAQTETGLIYAGGEAEILLYSGGSWAVANTSPITLTGEDITAAIVLTNGDILFGGNGRIIKLSGGTWSEETTLPTGQVYALLEASSGEVYAGDTGRILKRDTSGVWAEDDDLPNGSVYALFQASNGRLFAGENKRILRSATPTSSTIEVRVAALTDSAEQYGSTVTLSGVEGDLDFFNRNYAAMRFPLDIPPGAVINSAKLRLIAHRDHQGNSETARIYCENSANASAFAASSNNISNRSLTIAYREWQTSVKWKRNQAYESVDFATGLQQVINLPGWATGNYAGVIVKANTQAADPLLNTRREAFSYGLSPDKAPVLVVEFTIPPPAGQTWEIASTLPSGNVRSFAQVGSRLIAGEDGQMLVSQDFGQSWAELTTLPNGEVLAFGEDDDGNLYAGEAGAPGRILKSIDQAANWVVDNDTLPAGNIAAFVTSSDGVIRAGDDGYILKLALDDALLLGQEATDENWVFVVNHNREANITNIFVDDGGVFSSIFPMVTLPQALFPASPAVGDAGYFIIDASLPDAGPFPGLVFNIETPLTVAGGSATLVWELYQGGSWATASQLKDGTSGFTQVGVNSVHWAMSSNWQTVAVNGVTGWAIRVRISALTGTMTPPTQASRNIYSPCTAFIDIAEDQTSGTVDSLVKLQINNRSAGGGPGGSNPPLYQNRILAGVKAVENHETFRAFLNFSDEQNPDGVSLSTAVDADAATSLQTDTGLSAAAGKRVFFDASVAAAGAGLNNLADRAKLILATTVARDYYGTYRVFLRCKPSGGSAGQVSVRLKVVSGTGGISQLTDTQYTQTTSDHHLIEFEETITLPVSSQYTNEDIGDETSLTLQIASASSSADLYVYDLFLLPVDVSFVDAQDQANTANSAVDNASRLLIDSITVPKTTILAKVQKTANDLFKGDWYVDSKGPFTLLKVEAHRVWLLSARTEAAGSTVWISEPEVSSSVRAWKVDRWLFGRGLA